VIGNRCQIYNSQAAQARISNLRVWASANPGPPVEPEPTPESCDDGCSNGFKCVSGTCTCGPSPHFDVFEGVCLPSCGALIGNMSWGDGKCCSKGCVNAGQGPNATWDCNYCCSGIDSCSDGPEAPPESPPVIEGSDTDVGDGSGEGGSAMESDGQENGGEGQGPGVPWSDSSADSSADSPAEEPVPSSRIQRGCAAAPGTPGVPVLWLLTIAALCLFARRRGAARL
jgi:hypothetical protein